MPGVCEVEVVHHIPSLNYDLCDGHDGHDELESDHYNTRIAQQSLIKSIPIKLCVCDGHDGHDELESDHFHTRLAQQSLIKSISIKLCVCDGHDGHNWLESDLT